MFFLTLWISDSYLKSSWSKKSICWITWFPGSYKWSYVIKSRRIIQMFVCIVYILQFWCIFLSRSIHSCFTFIATHLINRKIKYTLKKNYIIFILIQNNRNLPVLRPCLIAIYTQNKSLGFLTTVFYVETLTWGRVLLYHHRNQLVSMLNKC